MSGALTQHLARDENMFCGAESLQLNGMTAELADVPFSRLDKLGNVVTWFVGC